MTQATSPSLAAPGKGLPQLEKWAIRYYYLPKFWKTNSWQSAQRLFDREGSKILNATQTLSPQQITKPVLVPRLPGIEDSSRFWSASMVMEHLIIVGQRMETAILELKSGRIPKLDTSIASVKPNGEMDSSQIRGHFETFIQRFKKHMEEIEAGGDSALRFRHAWFGDLTARQWHGLAALHQRTHRKHLESILKRI